MNSDTDTEDLAQKEVVSFLGRRRKGRARTETVGVKVTPEKRIQFQTLAVKHNLTLTEVFEQALDALEERKSGEAL
jgi:hypothetical protein